MSRKINWSNTILYGVVLGVSVFWGAVGFTFGLRAILGAVGD